MLRAETAHALKFGEVILTLGNGEEQLPWEPRGRAHGHQRLKIAFMTLNNVFLSTFHTLGKPLLCRKHTQIQQTEILTLLLFQFFV